MNSMKNAYRNHDEINLVCRQIKKCVKLVRTCDKMLLDNRGRRHSKTGVNQATVWEIGAVLRLNGQQHGKIVRTDYRTNVTPDHTINIWPKAADRNSNPWSATNEQLNELERREFPGKAKPIVAGISSIIGSNSSGIRSSVGYVQPDNSKLVNILGELGKVVAITSAIVGTIAMMRVDPAVENLKKTKEYLVGFNNFAKKTMADLQNKINKRKASKSIFKSFKRISANNALPPATKGLRTLKLH